MLLEGYVASGPSSCMHATSLRIHQAAAATCAVAAAGACCPGRQTFVFDASGKCLLSFNSQMDVLKHVDEALAVLKGQCSSTTSS